MRLDPTSKGLPLVVRSVVTRVHKRGRLLITWTGQGDWPPEYAPDQSTSFPIQERAWMAFEPSPNNAVTTAKICLHMTPGTTGSLTTSQAEVLNSLAKSIIPLYLRLMRERRQLTENACLDQLVAS